jgi:hypothetical protein
VSVSDRQPGTGWRYIVDDEVWLGRLMLAPAILYIALLIGAPFLLALCYSLTDITVGSPTMHFVGLEHFQEVVQTPKFLQALRNTLLFAFGSQLLVLVLANILAQVLRYEFRGKWLVRCLILLPWVAPISLGSIGWLWIFDSLYSVLNWTLQAFGFLAPTTRLMWLGKPNLALGCIIAVHVWRLLPLGDSHPDGRFEFHPAGHSRRCGYGRRGVLAASFPDHHAPGGPHYDGGRALWVCLRLHGHDRDLCADAGWSVQQHASAGEPGILHRH